MIDSVYKCSHHDTAQATKLFGVNEQLNMNLVSIHTETPHCLD